MSAKRLKGRESGFTLIEVTLAIVIGVIMIAGATLLYNQAKISAGNSRAQAKVTAAAAAVEEFTANSAGALPTYGQFQNLWALKRVEDFNQSPWGGSVGTLTASGSLNDNQNWTAGSTFTAVTTDTPAKVGMLNYATSTAGLADAPDLMIGGATRSIRAYALWIYNEKGRGPNFVTSTR